MRYSMFRRRFCFETHPSNQNHRRNRNFNNLPLMLSVPEVAKALGISRAGAYKLVRADSFPKIRIGNRIVVPRDKFLAWIDQQSEADA